MNKEVLSDQQGISIISLFIIGSSIVLTTAGAAKKDLWIAIILSIMTALPIVFVHSRLLVLFPEKDLYDILELIFGKFIGKGFSLLFVWFSFFLGGLVLRVFGDFIFIVSLPETPKIISMFMIGILCIWGAKEGIETLGRWGEFFLIGTILLILLVSLLLIHKMNINNLRPMLSEGIQPLIKGTFHAFIFPFTQTIVFTTFFSSSHIKSVYKVYILGIFIGGIILYVSSTTDILVLGSTTAGSMYFPTYTTARLLKIANLSSGFEIIITTSFLVGGFIKVCMCLLSTCNGVAKIFSCTNYKFIVTPIGLLIINLSYFIHDNVMDKAEFALDVYPSYALPFQVILPIIILISAEIKKKHLNNHSK
ncbi:GerAB/ArcD/ProY family transporter [Crassaminicella profunda]|uniref:GerAB/ArcD/ProY family transporter n=1 Tax=Crassaminicella profunda TaxID=1286698 RepID=UPI001CA65803|nr:endospore germination permease [Crassaminicella profunda]QZY56021.1 endospore germination permease [Crassaminicella profunda]